MKRVIITGPTGAIGLALIQMLVEKDIEVVAVCHCNSHKINRIPISDKVKIVECNLNEISHLPDMLNGHFDIFYHFAWEGTTGVCRDRVDMQMKNIQYTLDAVEVAGILGCTRFIGAGSQAEYGRYEGKLNAEIPAFPESGYGIAKLCAGQLSRLRCAQLGIHHIWTRILSVYGPYDGERTLIMSLISQFLKGQKPSCTKGEQIWDYIYSKDAAAAFYALGEKGQDGKIYCIGSGEGQPLADYIKIIRDAIDPQLKIGMGDVPYGDRQVMFLCSDISELIEDTGFVPAYSFEEGIVETIEWVRSLSV